MMPDDAKNESPSFPTAYALAQRAVRNEQRLAALGATRLLDSDVEEAFDRLTRLAVRLVKIPGAFVSLVDEHRDFYKSACGFGEPLAAARQLEGPTFCHFTIQSSEPLIIPDTMADPVYRDVPTVRSLGVAAYVGIPIIINDQAIGAFCAIDVAPHAWTEDEIGVLTELAGVAVSEISLRSARADSDRFREAAELLADASAVAHHEIGEQAQALLDQASDLERARGAAEAANRAKSDFLAAMSHDLRTPLNAIGGYAQLIEMGAHGPTTDGQRDAASRIVHAQRHLLALIDDILQFAKTESGQIPLSMRPVSLSELCHALESLVRTQADERQIAFSYHVGESASGAEETLAALADFDRVLQVLVNLSTNAIKFTEHGGSVTLSGRRAGAWAEIAITDTGRGIAEEHLERIFEPFIQVGGGSSAREGVGLGLSTSRNLARRMGGDIIVESTPGVGSMFVLRLPAT